MELTPDPILPPLPEEEYRQLRDSIRHHGVQVPLLVTSDGAVIDGHERLRACRELGTRQFPMRVLGRMTGEERREMAIRLNIERRHLSREERRRLLDSLIQADPRRSTREVADLLRIAPRTVGRARAELVAGGSIDPPESTKGRDGKVYPYRHPAVGVETPRQAQEASDLLNALGDEAPEGAANLRKLRTLAAQQRRDRASDLPEAKLPAQIQIKHCSYDELRPKAGSVSLILTDPPWGQDRETLALWEGLGEMAARALVPGGLLLTYCGQAGLPRWLEILGRHLTYRWQVVCVNASGHSIAPSRGSFAILNGYRCLLLYSNGPFHPPQPLKDTLVTDGWEKDLHPWQQPLDEARYFVEKLCPPGGLVCDPFCGSGTTAHAVLMAGAGRRYLGGDVSADSVRKARSRVTSARGVATPRTASLV
jgi:ParB-like chromosome segregation protein Spo0J